MTSARKEKLIYWTTTGLVAAVMTFSVVNFNLANPVGAFERPFDHLGLPDYLRVELTIAKTLGLAALLIPGVPARVREFAYCGFAITLVSAAFAHYSVGDSAVFVLNPLFFLGMLAVSYVYSHRIRRRRSSRSSAA